jgi:hypothetical protein
LFGAFICDCARTQTQGTTIQPNILTGGSSVWDISAPVSTAGKGNTNLQKPTPFANTQKNTTHSIHKFVVIATTSWHKLTFLVPRKELLGSW